MRINEIAQPKHNILTESCQGLTTQQRRIVEGIYNEFRPVLEVALNPQQINQLFAATQQAATAAGGNRTLIGRGMDAASAVNQAIDNVGKWLQNTAPVQAFDQKFETLKGNIADKFPQLGRAVSQLGDWAKANPGKTAAIVGVLTTIAALGAGPAGGAIAGQILRGTAELLKGEKLSTAVGKGVKTAAVGALAGWGLNKIGDILSGTIQDLGSELFPTARRLNFKFYATNTSGPSIFRDLKDVYVLPDDSSRLLDTWKAAGNAWRSQNYSQAQQLFDRAATMAQEFAKPEYLQQITQNNNNWEAMMQGADALKDASTALAAAAQGAASASDNKPAESKTMSGQQINEMFQRVEEGVWDWVKGKAAQAGQAIAGKVAQVGQNITTKVTADKLATAWKAAGSPTDSDQIFALLVKQGVDKNVLAGVWKQMQLPTPGTVPARPAAKPAAQPQAGMTANKFGSMVKNLTGQGAASSTGGTTQRTATGVRHTANPNNPNLAAT